MNRLTKLYQLVSMRMSPARWETFHISWPDSCEKVSDKKIVRIQWSAVMIQRLAKCRYTQYVNPIIAYYTPANKDARVIVGFLVPGHDRSRLTVVRRLVVNGPSGNGIGRVRAV